MLSLNFGSIDDRALASTFPYKNFLRIIVA